MYKVNLMDMEIGVDKGTKIYNLIKKYAIEDYNVNTIIACKVNGVVKSLNYEIENDCDITYIFINSTEGMRIYVRGLTLVLIKALNELYPEAKLVVDYSLGEALCCEIVGIDIIDEIVVALRNRMREIIRENMPIIKKTMSVEEVQEIYRKDGFSEKAEFIGNSHQKALSLYYIDEVCGYFYGKMPISTGYLNVFDLKKYEKGVIIMYPNKNDTNYISSMTMPKKLYRTFSEYEDFYETVGIKNINDLNDKIRSGEIKDIIMITEAMHEKKIAGIADKIAKDRMKKLILIAGPSSSGKTTFAQRLSIQLMVNKMNFVTLSMDNYFIERKDTPKDENGQYNFEAINVVDIEYLNSDIQKLMQGVEIELPEFDFITGTRQYNGKMAKLEPNGVIILEGIHCLNDELTPNIPLENKFKIFVSALTVLNVDGYNRISTTDTRLIRRIIRDSKFRNYTIEETMERWESVRRGEDKYIFPYQENADVMFNTSLPFEYSIFKDEIEELLIEVPKTSEYYSETNRIKTLITLFLPLESGDIPKNSILREFIGEGCFYR